MAAWAAWSSQEPVWAGVPDANRYPADCPVAPPPLTGLIFASLHLVKASPALPEPAQPGAPPAAQAGATPATRDGRGAPSGAPGSLGGRTGPGPPRGDRPAARPRPAAGQRLSRKASAARPTHLPQGGLTARARRRPSPSYPPLPRGATHRGSAGASGSLPPATLIAAAHQPARQYSPHPQLPHHTFALTPYEGQAMVHRCIHRAAETSRLIAPARLSTTKDDMYLGVAAFTSALGICRPSAPLKRATTSRTSS